MQVLRFTNNVAHMIVYIVISLINLSQIDFKMVITHLGFVVLLSSVFRANGDISGSNPAAGSCLCFTSNGVRIRNPGKHYTNNEWL